MLEQAQVVAELGDAGRDARERGEERVVGLARVRLAGHRVQPLETHLLRDEPVQLVDLRGIAVEQHEERRLRAGRAARATEAQRAEPVLDLLDIEQQVLDPECGALADGRGLRGLEMRVAERGQLAPAAREGGQGRDAREQPPQHELERLAVLDQLRVVRDVRAGRAEVDDAAGRGRHLAEVVDVRHHVMAQAALELGRAFEVDVIEPCTELLDRLGRDVQPQLALRLGQRQPESAPRLEFEGGGEQPRHLGRRVAAGERVVVGLGKRLLCGRASIRDRFRCCVLSRCSSAHPVYPVIRKLASSRCPWRSRTSRT